MKLPYSPGARGKLAVITGLCALLALSVGLIIYASHNLDNHYFWDDEASAFFTSLGWPGPGQPPGGWKEIWATLLTFLEPGTFEFLTRGWFEAFGGGITALRALPFTFFVLYLIGLWAWYRRFSLPLIIACAGIAVMLLENITPYYAVEVRPYSASLAAAVLLPLAVLWLKDKTNPWRTLVVIASFVFLATMQYNSASMDVGLAGLLVAIATTRRVMRVRVTFAALAALALVLLPTIYLITRGNPLQDQSTTLSYVSDLVLRTQTWSQRLANLRTNFFSLTALPRTVFLLILPILAAIPATRRWMASQVPRVQDLWLTWIYILIATLAAAAMSILGFLPWVVGSRWSITDIAYIGLSIAALIALAARIPVFSLTSMRIATSACALVVVGLATLRLISYERPNDVNFMASLGPALLQGRPQGVIIDFAVYPLARYWMEFGHAADGILPAWNSSGIASTPPFLPATARDVQDFINGPNDRMLFRSRQALLEMGIALPDNIMVVEVPTDALKGSSPDSVPVALIKR